MKYLYIVFISIMLLACEETIIIDVDQAEEKFVIEALVTNQPDHQVVRISRTVDFYANGIAPEVSNASVRVSDDQGLTVNYVEVDTLPGVYVPSTNFVGEVGNLYTLNIDIDGTLFTSTEEMLPVTTIDSVTYRLDEERLEEWGEDGYIYDVLLWTTEPQDEENFYLFKFYRNGIWLNDQGEDITVTDDVAVGEAIDGLEMPEHSSRGDSTSLEMYSLTRTQFKYWSDVANLIFSDGGVFSPLPANPRSNITGGALGIFQVSALESDYVIIE